MEVSQRISAVCRKTDYLLSKIDKYKMTERVPGSGRLRTASTSDNVTAVEKLVQEDNCRHTVQFVRQQETSIHHSSIHRKIRKDLALKCNTKKQAQGLTDANKKARLVHAW